jgi:hypothetical protein
MKILATIFKSKNYITPFHSYGILVEIDWDSKTIIRSLKVPAASFQDDTAFMVSYLGGFCLAGQRIFASAWNFIVEVDYDSFQIVNAVSWPPMADLHGMTTDGHDIWVASTAIDAVLCLDVNTLELKWRWGPDEPILYQDRLSSDSAQNLLTRLPLVRRVLGAPSQRSNDCHFIEREYRYIHKGNSLYHYHHLNGICFHEGYLYITTRGWNKDSQRSAVIRLDPRTRQSEFFVPPGGFRGMHDGIFINERFYTTESAANSVAWREPDGRIISRPIEPSDYFVRGLLYTGSSFLVGFSTWRESNLPAQIVEYDLEFEHQLGAMEVSMLYPGGQETGIYALALSPD